MRFSVALTLLGLIGMTAAWDIKFKASHCYPASYSGGDPMDAIIEDRMPMSIDNFVALLEKYERLHSFNPDRVADSLIFRYKTDGMIYVAEHTSGSSMFQPRELPEVNKKEVLDKVLTPSYEVPQDTFEPREECSLHYMLSHSTDTYPHPEIESFWEDGGGRRFRRQADQRAYYQLPPDVEPSNHPIENGVILTSSGPVALGTLLTGIAASVFSSEETIAAIFGDKEVVYMPDEMKSKRLNPLHTSTLAGDIGQASLTAGMTSTLNQKIVGPSGAFLNSTAAPKLFSHSEGSNGIVTYLTRAEIFAGIDAILIQQYLNSASSAQVKLSQVLRMYYSDYGLPNSPNSKACNRMDAYKAIRDDAKTKEQALNFMYAFGGLDSLAKLYISENIEDFQAIEDFFTKTLDNGWNAFTSFVDNYNYEDYERCPSYSSSSKQVKCENKVDLVVVYSREGGLQETQAEREYITILAELTGVAETRSRLGVIDAQNGNWIMPITNVSNIADLGANFTLNSREFGGGGSSSDMMKILDTLFVYYTEFYNVTNGTAQNATAPSQVVVWNVPRNAPNFDEEDNMKILREFREQFPNVYFLLVGNSPAEYVKVLADRERDFFKVNLLKTEETAQEIADRVCQIPSMFVYPACNTNIPQYMDYNEASHLFRGYISPNYTTYAMIAPHNFHYAYRMKLKLQTPDVVVCTSRVSQNVDTTAADYQCMESSNTELEWYELCTHWNLTKCNPIYLSISGTPSGNPRCSVDACEFPNQIEYTIGHEGLLCGAWSFSVSFLLMALMALLHILLV